MSRLSESKYTPSPGRRVQYKSAFVIQFLLETDISSGRIEGRVEHVDSNRTMRFCSLDELLGFLDQVLKDAHAIGGEPFNGIE